jgi:hypothetical protein
VPPLWMNGTNTAGMIETGSHDRPPPPTDIGMPGAVETSSGGPSSTIGAGGVVASCGTGITDFSMGVPCARDTMGRTGRHMTIVVECTGAAGVAAGAARLAVRATGRRGLTGFAATFGLGFVATAFRGGAFLTGATVLRRRTTGFALAGAATGEHSTRESTDARSGAICCEPRTTVSRLATWAPAGWAADRLAAMSAASGPIVNRWCFIDRGLPGKCAASGRPVRANAGPPEKQMLGEK